MIRASTLGVVSLLPFLLLAAQSGFGPFPSAESAYRSPIVVVADSAATVPSRQMLPSGASPASSILAGDRSTAILREAINESTIVQKLVGAASASRAHESYLLEVGAAAVALHEAGGATGITMTDLAEMVSRLASARERLLRTVNSFEEWLTVSQAIDPYAESYGVPDRFVEQGDLGTGIWTAEDSEIVQAADDLVQPA